MSWQPLFLKSVKKYIKGIRNEKKSEGDRKMKCLNCGKETEVDKFCSKECEQEFLKYLKKESEIDGRQKNKESGF